MSLLGMRPEMVEERSYSSSSWANCSARLAKSSGFLLLSFFGPKKYLTRTSAKLYLHLPNG